MKPAGLRHVLVASGLLLVVVACSDRDFRAGTAYPEINAPPESIVVATPFDPYHPPEEGRSAPDTVVELDLENRYDFDLIPRRVNGVPLEFNRDHNDNEDEPLEVPPGRTRFVFTNTGTISHNFRIQGTLPDGRSFDVTSPAVTRFLGPGDMWELELDLWEGDFTLTCAVTNHDDRGMFRPMTVSDGVAIP